MALAAFLASACNIVPIAQRQLERQYRAEGLEAEMLIAGNDRVHYWVGGRGSRPVLLLHGFGASAVWQWALQVESFAAEHRLIIPDLLWFGESSSTTADYSLDHQVAAVVALLDYLGEQRVDVVGISYGGLVAYELASAHPDRVRRLALVDSPGRSYGRADYEALCRRFGVEHFAEVLLPQDTEAMRRLVHLGVEGDPHAPGFVLRQARRELFVANAEQKRGMLDALLRDLPDPARRPDPRARDTLLVWGSHDPVFPLPLAHRLKEHLGPGARLEVIEHARHTPNLEWPERFDALVLQHLSLPCSCER